MNFNFRLMCIVAWIIAGVLFATAAVGTKQLKTGAGLQLTSEVGGVELPLAAPIGVPLLAAMPQYYKINVGALAVVGEAQTLDSFTLPARRPRVDHTADGAGPDTGAVASWFVKGTR